MDEWLVIALQIGIVVAPMLLGYFAGTYLEKKHFERIHQRELASQDLPVISLGLPKSWRVENANLVVGSAVVSLDYFKRILAGLRMLFGGRIRAYEPLLDRARREAVLRMKDAARAQNFDAVIEVRLETANLASTAGNGKGTAGIEVVAYGTGIKRCST